VEVQENNRSQVKVDRDHEKPMLQIHPRLQIPIREFTFTFERSSGPGGQNVNKVATKAILRWDILRSPSLSEAHRKRFLAKHGNRVSTEGVLILNSQKHRDQGSNVAECLEKLRALLLETAFPPKPRKKTRPTMASKRRRLANKTRKSGIKEMRRRPSRDD